jgi:hypothetical protein
MGFFRGDAVLLRRSTDRRRLAYELVETAKARITSSHSRVLVSVIRVHQAREAIASSLVGTPPRL